MFSDIHKAWIGLGLSIAFLTPLKDDPTSWVDLVNQFLWCFAGLYWLGFSLFHSWRAVFGENKNG